MEPKQSIIIIGGTGFIGNALTKALNTKDKIELSIIYKNFLSQNKFPKVKYHQLDAAKQGKKLGEIISNTECLVRLSQPSKKLIENITGFGSKIRKIIYASTLLLYPNAPQKQDENSLLKPINDYEKSKFNEEQILSAYAKTHNTKLCIVRPTNVYGDVKSRGIVQKIFSAILNGQEFIINGDGNQKRDFIFVEDIVNWLVNLILLKHEKSVNIFNLCSGEGYTINELITKTENIVGKKLAFKKGLAIKEKQTLIGDNRKIIEFTNRKLTFNIEEGLMKTYENNLKHKI